MCQINYHISLHCAMTDLNTRKKIYIRKTNKTQNQSQFIYYINFDLDLQKYCFFFFRASTFHKTDHNFIVNSIGIYYYISASNVTII